jgi:flagellar biosynthesis chaperone FliJ
MPVRSCWPALLLKANQALELAVADLVRARERVSALAQQRERVAMMMAEYAARHQTLIRSDHYVSESLSIQRFLAQLRLMLDRIDAESVHAEKACRAAVEMLNVARAQAKKFGKLIDLEAMALQDSALRSEARSLDEVALLQFRLREP